jgi:hypothetical protein
MPAERFSGFAAWFPASSGISREVSVDTKRAWADVDCDAETSGTRMVNDTD